MEAIILRQFYHQLKVSLALFYCELILNLKIGEFTEEDFSFDECDQISSIILEEAKTFITFMQTLIENMLGKEDSML